MDISYLKWVRMDEDPSKWNELYRSELRGFLNDLWLPDNRGWWSLLTAEKWLCKELVVIIVMSLKWWCRMGWPGGLPHLQYKTYTLYVQQLHKIRPFLFCCPLKNMQIKKKLFLPCFSWFLCCSWLGEIVNFSFFF